MENFVIFCSSRRKSETQSELDLELTFYDILLMSSWILKSDPNMYEIFHSPFIYYSKLDLNIFNIFKNLIYKIYDFNNLIIHYFNWSYGNYIQLTQKKKNRIVKKPLKILFVVYRGILTTNHLIDTQVLLNIFLYIFFMSFYIKFYSFSYPFLYLYIS